MSLLHPKPEALRAFHKWAAILWATVGLAITLRWPDSILWVAFMSLWANVGTHWSAHQGARAETNNGDTDD